MVRAIAFITALVASSVVHADTLEGEPDLLDVDVDRGWAFAVGEDGAIWSKHLRRGEWTGHRKTTQTDLLSVSVISRRDVWVVGVGGMFIHYDGEEWLSPGGSTSRNFRAVLFRGRRRGLAVGDKRVRHYVRRSWDAFSAMTKVPSFHGLARVGRGRHERFVAVGADGAAVSFSGVGKSLAADIEVTGTKETLVAVDGCRRWKSEAIAVGEVAVLRAPDGTWTELAAPPEPLSDVVVQCKRGDIVRAFGTGDAKLAVYDADKKAWSTRAVEGATRLNALAWKSRKELLVVGDDGFVAVVPADEQ